MSLVLDMLSGLRRPRELMRRKLDQGVREDRALAVLMGACLLSFVSRWPAISRAAVLHPDIPRDARMGAELLVFLFLLPPAAYGMALLSQGVLRLIGRPVSGYGARLALFWALFCLAPLLLFYGLVAGFMGDGGVKIAVGVAVFVIFIYLWCSNVLEAMKA